MKTKINKFLAVVVAFAFALVPEIAEAKHVRSYKRVNGAHVRTHYRSKANKSKSDNLPNRSSYYRKKRSRR